MQKSAIYKAGYAQGSGKAVKAAAKRDEKQAAEAKKVIAGRVEKEKKELRPAVPEGPQRLALLKQLSPAAYDHVLAKAKAFQTAPIPGAPSQCRAIVRAAVHVGHQRRRHHVAIDRDIAIDPAAGSRNFMTHMVLAFGRSSGFAIGDDGALRAVAVGDETSHPCHQHDCVACAVIESGRRNTLRNQCRDACKCICGLNPPCVFV